MMCVTHPRTHTIELDKNYVFCTSHHLLKTPSNHYCTLVGNLEMSLLFCKKKKEKRKETYHGSAAVLCLQEKLTYKKAFHPIPVVQQTHNYESACVRGCVWVCVCADCYI